MLGLFQFCPQPSIRQQQSEEDDDKSSNNNSNSNNNNNNNNNEESNRSLFCRSRPASSHLAHVVDDDDDDDDETGEPDQNSPSSASSVQGSDKEPSNKRRTGSSLYNLFWDSPLGVFLTDMGGCLSRAGGAPMIESPDGGEIEYHNRFIEDRVLGEGEFGVVRLVYDMKESSRAPNIGGGGGGEAMNGAAHDGSAYACKTLRKGVVFKDNTLFAPLKPEILRGEIEMLRTLNGEHFCLKLVSVFETSRLILMVTEYCCGGEMMEYLSKQEEDLRTDDVSRIAFQLLDAVHHCAKHDIIHRDIKPENIMFQNASPGSDLRLIDFGSGTNKTASVGANGEPADDGLHTTFAGSAFYISPEMFQRTYTQKTDVWSVGVTLYVLVAGYPADELQKAFNLLQCVNRNLRLLPKMPDNMPESYYDMLDGMLVYRHKKRKTAGEMILHEFVQFHTKAFSIDQIAMAANSQNDTATDDQEEGKDVVGPLKRRTQSVSLRGSVTRHSMILDYHKFERSLTTLLATLLDKNELATLMRVLKEKVEEKAEAEQLEQQQRNESAGEVPTIPASIVPKAQRLDVIPVGDLNKVLEELKEEQVLSMVKKLPNADIFKNFAYRLPLLKDFVRDEDAKNKTMGSKVAERMARSGGSFRASIFKFGSDKGGSSGLNPRLDSSTRSVGSGRNSKTASGSGNIYQEWKSKGLVDPKRKHHRSASSGNL